MGCQQSKVIPFSSRENTRNRNSGNNSALPMKRPRPGAIVAYDSNHLPANGSSGTLDSYNAATSVTSHTICEREPPISTKDDKVSVRPNKFLYITSIVFVC